MSGYCPPSQMSTRSYSGPPDVSIPAADCIRFRQSGAPIYASQFPPDPRHQSLPFLPRLHAHIHRMDPPVIPAHHPTIRLSSARHFQPFRRSQAYLCDIYVPCPSPVMRLLHPETCRTPSWVEQALAASPFRSSLYVSTADRSRELLAELVLSVNPSWLPCVGSNVR